MDEVKRDSAVQVTLEPNSWKVAYDVRKTDSLVTPLIGTIELEDFRLILDEAKKPTTFRRIPVAVTFVRQDDKWHYKSYAAHEILGRFKEGSPQILQDGTIPNHLVKAFDEAFKEAAKRIE